MSRACKFWAQGNCKKGNRCTFRHVGPSGGGKNSTPFHKSNSFSSPGQQYNQLCRHFLKGHCFRGDTCRYIHQQSNNQNQQPRGRRNNNDYQNSYNTARANSAPPRISSVFSSNNSNRSKSLGRGNYFGSKFAPQSSNAKSNVKTNKKSYPQNYNTTCRGHNTNRCHEYVERDFREQSWPLSCYGHDLHFPSCIKGDVSFEEARLAYYNNATACNNIFDSMVEVINNKKNAIMQDINLLFQEDTSTIVSYEAYQMNAGVIGDNTSVKVPWSSVQTGSTSSFLAAPSAISTTANVFPTTSSVFSATSSAFPASSNASPTSSSVFPTSSNAFPATTNASPATSNIFSTNTSVFPATSSAFPSTSVAFPTVPSGFSTTPRAFPATPSAFSTASNLTTVNSAFQSTSNSSPIIKSAFATMPNNSSPATSSAFPTMANAIPIPSSGATNQTKHNTNVKSYIRTKKWTGPIPAHCMTQEEMMTHFYAPSFTLGKIPETPPPPALA